MKSKQDASKTIYNKNNSLNHGIPKPDNTALPSAWPMSLSRNKKIIEFLLKFEMYHYPPGKSKYLWEISHKYFYGKPLVMGKFWEKTRITA